MVAHACMPASPRSSAIVRTAVATIVMSSAASDTPSISPTRIRPTRGAAGPAATGAIVTTTAVPPFLRECPGQAWRVAAASERPSSSIADRRISTLRTLPLTVIGNASTTRT